MFANQHSDKRLISRIQRNNTLTLDDKKEDKKATQRDHGEAAPLSRGAQQAGKKSLHRLFSSAATLE